MMFSPTPLIQRAFPITTTQQIHMAPPHPNVNSLFSNLTNYFNLPSVDMDISRHMKAFGLSYIFSFNLFDNLFSICCIACTAEISCSHCSKITPLSLTVSFTDFCSSIFFSVDSDSFFDWKLILLIILTANNSLNELLTLCQTFTRAFNSFLFFPNFTVTVFATLRPWISILYTDWFYAFCDSQNKAKLF